jgi:hypothetical protein
VYAVQLAAVPAGGAVESPFRSSPPLPSITHPFRPDPAQNLDEDPDPDPDPDPGGGGGRSAKNVHPPWQNPRYAPG